MKVQVFIILFAVSIFACSAQSVVPEFQWTPDPMCPYPSEKIYYFPYPYNCSQYWECFEGKKYLKDCPKNLWWNQQLEVCDYPDNVNCVVSSSTSDGTTTSRTTVTDDTSSSFSSTKSSESTTGNTDNPTTQSSVAPTSISPLCPDNTVLSYEPYPYDCNKFVECNYGTAKIMTCPNKLHWNAKVKSCDYPENAHCEASTSVIPTTSTTEVTTKTSSTSEATTTTTKTSSISTDSPTTSSQSPTTKSDLCPEESGLSYHSYPYDCQKFVECNNGHANILICPNKLEWNDVAKTCDFPQNANCKASTSVKPATHSYW